MRRHIVAAIRSVLSFTLVFSLVTPSFAAAEGVLQTTLSADPAAPNGSSDWYTTAPSITLSNPDATNIYYGWDEPATTGYAAPFSATEGVHVLNYYAVDSIGTAETSRTATFKVDTAAPSAPTLSLGTVTSNSVALSWTTVNDPTSGTKHYEVWRGGTLLGTPTSPSFNATGLSAGTPHTFTVKTVDNAGWASVASNAVEVTLDGSAPTTTHSSVPASANGTDGWFKTAPSITLSTEPGASTLFRWGSANFGPYTGSFSAPVGTNTLEYYSIDSVGNTEAPAKSAVFKVDTAAPNAPTLSLGTVTSSSVALSWTTVNDATSGTKHYEVWRGTTLLGTPTSPSYTATGLSAGTPYTFTVKTVDNAGWTSVASNAVNVTLDGTAPITSHSTVPASADGTDNWFKTAPSITLSTEPGASTQFRWGSDSFGPYAGAFTAPQGTNTLEYRSTDSVGNTETPAQSAVFKVDTAAPDAPTLSLGTVTSSSVALSWNDVSDSVSGTKHYEVYLGTTLLGTPTSPAYTATGLSAGTPHTFTVKTVDNAGWASEASNAVEVTLDDAAPTTTHSSVPASADGTDGWFKSVPSITLSTEPGASTLYRWGSEGFGPYTGAFTASQGTNTLEYYSIDSIGNTEAPAKSMVFKVDTTAPLAPAPKLGTVTSNSVSLSWTKVDDTFSGTRHYEVWRGTTLLARPTSPAYTATGLTPGASYTFTVKTVDKAGWTSVASAPITATTSSVAVGGPVKVTYGSSAGVTVYARTNKKPAVGVSVKLQRSTNGGSSWADLKDASGRVVYKRTGTDGNAVFGTEFKPVRRTWYRAVATMAGRPVDSPAKSVAVDPVLTISAPVDVVRTTSTTKYYFTVTGSLKPAHAVNSKDVSVLFYQNGQWVKTIKGTSTASDGTWSVKTTLGTKGTYTYKASVGAYSDATGAVHNGYTTPSKTLYVNRPKLSIYANRTTITYSTPATIYGYLKRRSGSAMSGRTVYLEKSTNGTTWSIYKKLKTTSTGKASYTVKPEKTTYYRLRFPGETYHMSRTTAAKRIVPNKYTGSKTFAKGADEMTTPEALLLPKGWHRVKVRATRGIAWTAVGINGNSTAVAWWDDNISSNTTGTFKFYAKEKAYYFIQTGNSSSGKTNGNTLWWELW